METETENSLAGSCSTAEFTCTSQTERESGNGHSGCTALGIKQKQAMASFYRMDLQKNVSTDCFQLNFKIFYIEVTLSKYFRN